MITWTKDLVPLLKKVIVINSSWLYPAPPDGELGAVYPYPLLQIDDDPEYYGIIIIHIPRLKTLDDYIVTLVHELIHVYLYVEGIDEDEHDESEIEKNALHIVKREYDKILKWIKENGLYFDI